MTDTAPLNRRTVAAIHRHTHRARAWWRVGIGMIAATGIAAAVVSIAAVCAPDVTDRAYGTTVTLVQKVVATATETVTGTPTRTALLGGDGTPTDLNTCDGTFTHMTTYNTTPTDGVVFPGVWAAHNKCGGDTILSWELGDHATLTTRDGTTTAYTVTDIRLLPKTATVTDLNNLNGLIALQTCFYGQNLMKIVALTPTAGAER